MVPFDACSIETPHCSIAFCNGWLGGTQCESLSSMVLSWADAPSVEASASAAAIMAAASFMTSSLANLPDGWPIYPAVFLDAGNHYRAAPASASRGRRRVDASGEARLHVGRDRKRLEPARIGRIGAAPHPRLETFDRKLARPGEPVHHIETRTAEFGDARFDHHVVAVARRDQKPRARVDQRKAADPIDFAHAELAHADHLLEQMPGAIVENGEITREIHDAHRVAIAPFDAHRSDVRT